MNPMKTHQRRLKNLCLTEKYRFQYLGHWVLVCFLFLVLLNLCLYALYEQVWLDHAPAGLDFPVERMHHNMQVAGLLVAVSAFFGMAILLLSIFTAHRIGGPFIALKRTMAQIEKGDWTARLRFRRYDKLEDVEQAFNSMMDALQTRHEGRRSEPASRALPTEEPGRRPSRDGETGPHPGDNESVAQQTMRDLGAPAA